MTDKTTADDLEKESFDLARQAEFELKLKAVWPGIKDSFETELRVIDQEISNGNYMGAGYILESHLMRSSMLAGLISNVVAANLGTDSFKKKDHFEGTGQYL